jgi:2-polyprenyl-6-hydroxyphenyl methylase/3-demethylubiquinone-9 3-methyltransferase
VSNPFGGAPNDKQNHSLSTKIDISGYEYSDAELNCAHEYLLPTIFAILESTPDTGMQKKIFELGCGNGVVANALHSKGFQLTGVDPSSQGIAHANRRYPHLSLALDSSESDLAERYGRFPFVLSLEVIEHVYAPRQFARRIYELLEPGGMALISTPYHGYFKNLALALTGRFDDHFTALWDNGHIKFWSMKTMGKLLEEAKFRDIEFRRVGRIPALAKSMIAIARKAQLNRS